MKPTEFELINHAVHTMRQERVAVTPANVERALNAAQNKNAGSSDLKAATAGLSAAMQSLDRTLAETRKPSLVTQVRRELAKPGNEGVIARVDEERRRVRFVMASVPYYRLSDAKRAEYESEATALRAKIAAPGLLPGVKRKLQQDLKKIEDLLAMDRTAAPDSRTRAERQVGGR